MNTKYIVVGIDGTGSREWMAKDGSNSHTYKFVRDVHYGAMEIDRRWFHGPFNTVTGSDSEPILKEALDFIHNRIQHLFPAIRSRAVKPLELFDVNSCMQQQSAHEAAYGNYRAYRAPVTVTPQMLSAQPLTTNDVRVVLIGHSRGGLVATVLARMLSPLVRVYFLGLYDSVDRQGCLDGTTIDNVQYVAHALRHPDVHSRGSFSNTSRKYSGINARDYQEREFYTSHGGIGGDFIADPKAVSFFGDSSCTPTTDLHTEHGTFQVERNPVLVKRLGKKMDLICKDGSLDADQYIRTQAKKYGVPIQ